MLAWQDEQGFPSVNGTPEEDYGIWLPATLVQVRSDEEIGAAVIPAGDRKKSSAPYYSDGDPAAPPAEPRPSPAPAKHVLERQKSGTTFRSRQKTLLSCKHLGMRFTVQLQAGNMLDTRLVLPVQLDGAGALLRAAAQEGSKELVAGCSKRASPCTRSTSTRSRRCSSTRRRRTTR